MNIVVAAFYADIPGKPSRLNEFLPLILASRRALFLTNPNAKYVILTDSLTGELLRDHVDYKVVAPEHMALMPKILFAQQTFLSRCEADFIILTDVDCLANRSFDDVTPDYVGFATTQTHLW